MKNIKKLFSIVMVLAMVLALGVNAFAADVTINGPAGHTYQAYPVFTGTTVTVDGHERLAAIQWANETGAAELVKALQDDATIGSKYFGEGVDVSTAEKVAAIMSTINETAEKQALARVLLNNAAKLGDPISLVAPEGGKASLAPGYYVIEDTTAVEGAADAKNEIILEVVGSEVTVEVKQDVPSSEKKVQDVNDSKASSAEGDNKNPTDWQDSADYDIGDDVPFQITGTLPSNLDSYTTYTLVFHDKQDAGLTLNKDFVVTVGGEEATEGEDYTVVTEGLTDDCTFEIRFNNIKTVEGAANGAKVVVTYSSKLNENAVIGSDGNLNTMHMTFSNNPGGEGQGKTPDDTVIVFTYTVEVDKVDGDNKPLDGAGFTLYKKNAAGEYVEHQNGAKQMVKPVYGDDAYEEDGSLKEDAKPEKYVVDFKGLDDGDYKLVETEVPDGYNKADDLEFTITAEHDVVSPNPGLTSLTSDQLTVKSNEEGKATGHLSTTVVNRNGLELPETGGIGTTIFYVVGAVLVVGAVILLVTKRRMTGAEK